MFQIVWFYKCGLSLGSTVSALTIVLSSFMGGLALGNALAGHYATRYQRLLRVYAGLELVIALSGVFVTRLLSAGPLFGIAWSAHSSSQSLMGDLGRFVTAFALLIVPATAMGASLPILVGALSRSGVAFGPVLGRLYGWNTLGAVAGVLSAEIVLVSRVGIWGTALTAALLNSVAAVIALYVDRSGRHAAHAHPVPEAGRTNARSVSSRAELANSSQAVAFRSRWRLLACAFLSGAALLALEVIWFRFLSMYVLTTTLAASLMLAVVLCAIALGGLAASAWLRWNPFAARHLTMVAAMAGVGVASAYAGFEVLTSGTQVGEWLRVLWFASVLTLPTSFVSGVLFTLVGDALHRNTRDGTRAAAWLTFANTLGSMCGPPVAAFILLPMLGMERSFFGLALTYGAIAAMAFDRRSTVRPPGWANAVAVAALALVLILFPFGAMRERHFVRVASAYATDGSTVVATREGPSETILLMQQTWLGKPVYHRLVTNGFSMSGTAVPGMRYMRYFAYLPALVHATPLRSALVVCYGVGVTARAVTDIQSLETIDIAEISRDVVAMSDIIYAQERHPLHDPRVRLHIEDGRYFLETTRERYDLITGEPPPPRTPGAVNIYTREYFRLIHDRLNEGGMATYWVPVARPQPGADVDTIIRAFCDVFADCSLWNATPFDLMLMGSRGTATSIDAADLEHRWKSPALAAGLREVGFEQPEQIGATFLGDADNLRELTAATPPLTDDFPQRLRPVSSRASLSDPRYTTDPGVAERYLSLIEPTRARSAFERSAFVRRLLPSPLVERTPPFFTHQGVVNRVFWEGGRPLRQIEDLDALLTQTSLQTLPLWVLGSDEAKQRIAESSGLDSGEVAYARGLRALSQREFKLAALHLARAQRLGLSAPTLQPLIVYSMARFGRIDEARELASDVRPRDPEETHFWSWMGPTFGVGPFGNVPR